MEPLTIAGDVLRAARRSAGLTQLELASLAETSQSAVAAYEGGSKQPTLPVLLRLIRAAGHALHVDVAPDADLFRLADLANEIRSVSDESVRLRLVFEFLRGVAEDGHPLVLLVAREPESTGDRRFDAMLAAIAEDLCVHAGLAPPQWVGAEERFLDGFWWVSPLPSARARALVHAPASFRRRGVMIDRHDLQAA